LSLNLYNSMLIEYCIALVLIFTSNVLMVLLKMYHGFRLVEAYLYVVPLAHVVVKEMEFTFHHFACISVGYLLVCSLFFHRKYDFTTSKLYNLNCKIRFSLFRGGLLCRWFLIHSISNWTLIVHWSILLFFEYIHSKIVSV